MTNTPPHNGAQHTASAPFRPFGGETQTSMKTAGAALSFGVLMAAMLDRAPARRDRATTHTTPAVFPPCRRQATPLGAFPPALGAFLSKVSA